MRCTNCGAIDDRPRFFPVYPKLPRPKSPEELTRPMDIEVGVRWTCQRCGRIHFRDGTPVPARAQREEPGP